MFSITQISNELPMMGVVLQCIKRFDVEQFVQNSNTTYAHLGRFYQPLLCIWWIIGVDNSTPNRVRKSLSAYEKTKF